MLCDSGPADHSRRRLILTTTVRRTMTSRPVFHVKPCQHNGSASTSLPICVVHSHLQRPGRTKTRCPQARRLPLASAMTTGVQSSPTGPSAAARPSNSSSERLQAQCTPTRIMPFLCTRTLQPSSQLTTLLLTNILMTIRISLTESPRRSS